MMVERRVIRASRLKIAKIILATPVTKAEGFIMTQWGCAGANLLCIYLNWPSWLVLINIFAAVLTGLGYLIPLILARRGTEHIDNDVFFRATLERQRRQGRPARF
jgi:hypothetical protein